MLADAAGDFIAHGLIGALVARGQQLVLQAAKVFDLAHGINQAPELFNRQVLVRLAERLIFKGGRNVRFEAGFALRLDPFGQGGTLVDGLVALPLAQVEAFQQGVDLVGVVGIQALARGLALELLDVAQALVHFLLRVIGGPRGIVLNQLVALLGRSGGEVARLDGLLAGLGCAHLGVGVLAGLDVAHLEAGNHGPREFLGGTGKHLALAGCLRQGVGFRRHEAGAGVVVDGLVGGLLDGLGARQVAELFQHAHVGKRADFSAWRFSGRQLAHQFVAGREAEHFGHNVGVQRILARHAQGFDAGDNLGRQVHGGNGGTVKAPGGKRLRIDHLVAGAGFNRGVVIEGHRVLFNAAQFLEELVLELAQIPFAVLVGREVAVLAQRLGHAVDSQTAFTAQHVLAEHRHGQALFRVDAPLRLHQVAPHAAQLGDGGKE